MVWVLFGVLGAISGLAGLYSVISGMFEDKPLERIWSAIALVFLLMSIGFLALMFAFIP